MARQPGGGREDTGWPRAPKTPPERGFCKEEEEEEEGEFQEVTTVPKKRRKAAEKCLFGVTCTREGAAISPAQWCEAHTSPDLVQRKKLHPGRRPQPVAGSAEQIVVVAVKRAGKVVCLRRRRRGQLVV
jgi:hypothetical protein